MLNPNTNTAWEPSQQLRTTAFPSQAVDKRVTPEPEQTDPPASIL